MSWFDIDACRAEVAKKYDSPNWRAKIKCMPDNQVIAIYSRMFIDKPKRKKSCNLPPDGFDMMNCGDIGKTKRDDLVAEQLALDI